MHSPALPLPFPSLPHGCNPNTPHLDNAAYAGSCHRIAPAPVSLIRYLRNGACYSPILKCYVTFQIQLVTQPLHHSHVRQYSPLIQFSFLQVPICHASFSLSLHIQRIAALLLHFRRQKVQEINFKKQTVFGKT